jgi:transposase
MERMQKKTKQRYGVEFKDEAVRRAEALRPNEWAGLAAELGVNKHTLEVWVYNARKRARESGEMLETEKQELLRLRRELKVVTMERDFLKKTAAFFARESK